MGLDASNSEKPDTLLTVSKTDILKLSRTRLKKGVSIAVRLLVDDDSKDIHDLRVSSRRLQQVISLLFPKPRHGKSRKVIRSLRKLRRDWSACRNFDVNLVLLEEKLESLTADGARDAWDYVRRCLLELRAQEFDRAKKRLRNLDILSFIRRTEQLFDTVKTEKLQNLDSREIFADTLTDWDEAIVQAKSNPDSKHLHEMRISGKRLRYRLEVLAELDNSTAEYVNSLKALQDELGRWHDWHVLLHFVTDLSEKPEFVRDHPELRQILTRDVAEEACKNNERFDPILKQAEMLQLKLGSFKDHFKASPKAQEPVSSSL